MRVNVDEAGGDDLVSGVDRHLCRGRCEAAHANDLSVEIPIDPRNHGLPVPSTIRALVIRMSNSMAWHLQTDEPAKMNRINVKFLSIAIRCWKIYFASSDPRDDVWNSNV